MYKQFLIFFIFCGSILHATTLKIKNNYGKTISVKPIWSGNETGSFFMLANGITTPLYDSNKAQITAITFYVSSPTGPVYSQNIVIGAEQCYIVRFIGNSIPISAQDLLFSINADGSVSYSNQNYSGRVKFEKCS